ncbi:SIMPL domain-containing protein [Chryseobacterium tongliaoense]|uniref:SIMPL domain-containing protein n=1 Tax=Chryseobacterium tongliaoense TaxID=3240933 RepID=UPI003516DFEA
MKTIIIFLFSFAATCSIFGQGIEKPYIEVRGIAKIERTIKSYTLDIVINEDLTYAEEKRTLEQIKKAFLDKAKAAGFDVNRFKEDQLAYALTQYGAEGTSYSFETAKPEEVIALNQLVADKTGAVSLITRRITYMPVKDFSKIIAAAFANGKERAEKVAATLGKKLGPLQTAIDYSTTDEEKEDTVYYRPDEERFYYLSLKYLIE